MALKLGTETGSVINHIYSRMTKGAPEPVVGMGVTMLGWTDREPGTIVRVFQIGKDLAIEVQADNYQVVSGSMHDGSAQYEYRANPDAHKVAYRYRKNAWNEVRFNVETKRWNLTGGKGIIIGMALSRRRTSWPMP